MGWEKRVGTGVYLQDQAPPVLGMSEGLDGTAPKGAAGAVNGSSQTWCCEGACDGAGCRASCPV